MRTTHPIAILDERRDTVIDRYWFAFVCLYLRKIYSSVICLKVNIYDIEPHEKVYSARMEQQPTQMELQVQFWHIPIPVGPVGLLPLQPAQWFEVLYGRTLNHCEAGLQDSFEE